MTLPLQEAFWVGRATVLQEWSRETSSRAREAYRTAVTFPDELNLFRCERAQWDNKMVSRDARTACRISRIYGGYDPGVSP